MKTHPTDPLSLLPGLVFVAIAVVALADGLTLDVLGSGWLWPVLFVALGLGVLASAGVGRRSQDTDDPTTAPLADPDDTDAGSPGDDDGQDGDATSG